MQILLASAKIMRERCHCAGIEVTHPLFEDVASKFAADLSRMTVDEIADAFLCSRKIAELNIERYKIFGSDEAELTPAIFAYFGQAYKHLKGKRPVRRISDSVGFRHNFAQFGEVCKVLCSSEKFDKVGKVQQLL